MTKNKIEGENELGRGRERERERERGSQQPANSLLIEALQRTPVSQG